MAEVANARALRRERVQRRALKAGALAHPPKPDMAKGTYWDALLDKYVSPEDAQWSLTRYRIVTGDPTATKLLAQRPSSSTPSSAATSSTTTTPSRPRNTVPAKTPAKAATTKTTTKTTTKKPSKKKGKKKTSRR